MDTLSAREASPVLASVLVTGKWLIALLISWGITATVLLFSPLISRVLKERGSLAVERLMGMLLVMVSVQMFLNGLEHYLKR